MLCQSGRRALSALHAACSACDNCNMQVDTNDNVPSLFGLSSALPAESSFSQPIRLQPSNGCIATLPTLLTQNRRGGVQLCRSPHEGKKPYRISHRCPWPVTRMHQERSAVKHNTTLHARTMHKGSTASPQQQQLLASCIIHALPSGTLLHVVRCMLPPAAHQFMKPRQFLAPHAHGTRRASSSKSNL